MLRNICRKIPYSVLLPVSVVLGLAPFRPEPHLVEKLRLLLAGQLRRPIDMFDLFLHAAPLILLLIKFILERAPEPSGPRSPS